MIAANDSDGARMTPSNKDINVTRSVKPRTMRDKRRPTDQHLLLQHGRYRRRRPDRYWMGSMAMTLFLLMSLVSTASAATTQPATTTTTTTATQPTTSTAAPAPTPTPTPTPAPTPPAPTPPAPTPPAQTPPAPTQPAATPTTTTTTPPTTTTTTPTPTPTPPPPTTTITTASVTTADPTTEAPTPTAATDTTTTTTTTTAPPPTTPAPTPPTTTTPAPTPTPTTPAPTTTTEAPTSSGVNIGALIAIVVVIVLLVVALVIAVVLYLRRRKAQRGQNTKGDFEMEERGSENGVVNTGFDMSHKKRNAVSRPVPINYLLDHIVGLSKKNGFKEEFIAITTGPRCPVTASLKDENRDKNRFYNILAYDHTRVVLEAEDVEAEYVNIQEVIGDYINANYINGYKQDKGFIAAQGPLNTTVADFWRMVWQNNSSKIVMVTNLVEAGRSKCAYYWPHEGSDQYGNIRVRLEKEDTFSEYVVRILELTKGKEKRTVLQYHFVAWPDEGCPTTGTALLALQDVIQSEPANESEGPVVIHCSAGIGRTGTFLAVDHLRKQAAEEGVVDVMACVDGMRQERVNMVQSLEQYAYIYTTILEALVCGQVRWPAKEFPGQVSALVDSSFEDEETPVVKQFKVLEALKPSGSYNERVKTAIDPANKAKNRKSNLLPAENVHPYLQPIQGCASSYINCVLFNSFKARDAVGVTQMPLPHTQIDFWRLVADFKCFCIVMLNEQEEDSESVPPYLPSLEEPVTLGSFTIKADKISEEDSFVVSDLMISASHKWKEEKPIHHVRLTSWPDDQPIPDSPRLLIDLHKRIKEICGPSYDGRTLVHCLYGAEKSGLVCAALHILDAIEAHAYVDVFNVVKKMRQSRPQFIATQEQYNYLHLVAKEYLESRSSS